MWVVTGALHSSMQDLLKHHIVSDVTYNQLCALHLTHPKCTHTAVNTHTHTHTPGTHTRSSGQPFMLRRKRSSWGFGGALLKGTSSCIEGGESAVQSLPPHTIPAGPRLELTSFGLLVRLSNIRPWLPHYFSNNLANVWSSPFQLNKKIVTCFQPWK